MSLIPIEVSPDPSADIKEISKYALQGILANPAFYEHLIGQQKKPGCGDFASNAAKLSIEYAIALYTEQQKL